MSKHPLEAFYDDLWRQRGAELTRHERDRIAAILGIVKGLERPNPRILDAGCGQGKVSARLKAHGQVTAVDWSEAGLNHGRRLLEGVEFQRLDLVRDSIDALRGRFGLTVSSEVLEHVGRENRLGFVSRLRDTLVPGGHLVLTTPNRRRVEDLSDLPALYQPEEELLLPEETLELVEAAGLVVRATRSATFLERAWEGSSLFRRLRQTLPSRQGGSDVIDRLLARSRWGLYFIVHAQRP